jgi:hypothetical protein
MKCSAASLVSALGVSSLPFVASRPRYRAAEPRRNGFDLWGYQDDRPEIVHPGSGANEEQLERLANEFLLGDPEIINPAFFSKSITNDTC